MENSTMNEELTITNLENGAAIYEAQNRAEIDTMVATAKAYPRNVKRSTDNAISIATMDIETAKTCGFCVPRGGKTVVGKSVHLAKIIAQTWGNLRVETKVIAVGDKDITSQAICFDLENNVAIKVEVKRSIMSKNGRFNDDMIIVTGNAANSIALRNAILSVVPTAVSNKVYEASKQAITGDLSDETKRVQMRIKLVSEFKDNYNISESELLKILSINSLAAINADKYIQAAAIWQSLKDGDTSRGDLLGSNSSREIKPEVITAKLKSEPITPGTQTTTE